MYAETICLRPDCRKRIPVEGNHPRKWCSRRCCNWAKRHPEIAGQKRKYTFLPETAIDVPRLVTDFLVGCRSSAELATQHNTTAGYIESLLRRMGVSHPDIQRTFDLPSGLLRDLAAAS